MKKIILVAITTVILFSFNSCSKYEDGPALSLRTKKARLSQTWKLDEIDREKVVDVSELSFEKNGDVYLFKQYEGTEGTITQEIYGEWEWEDDKEKIEIKWDNITGIDEYKILRLTKDEFWCEVNHTTELRFDRK